MDIAEALQIVIDLAKTAKDNLAMDDGPGSVKAKREEAINMVEDLAVNEYGDDDLPDHPDRDEN